jgi:hypothetical protein
MEANRWNQKCLRVEEIGKRLDDFSDYTQECNLLEGIEERNSKVQSAGMG